MHLCGIDVDTAPGIVAAAPHMLLFYSHAHVGMQPRCVLYNGLGPVDPLHQPLHTEHS
jgi:hypothetical protein